MKPVRQIPKTKLSSVRVAAPRLSRALSGFTMRIQFKIRTLLIVVFMFALFCATRSRSVANANLFVESIGTTPELVVGGIEAGGMITNDAKKKLLADANLPSSRYSLKAGYILHPKVVLMPRSLADRLLMRSTYRVEFKTYDKTRKRNPAVGLKLYHNRHESDYQTDIFGVTFVRSTKN